MEKPTSNKLMNASIDKYFSYFKAHQSLLILSITFVTVIFVYVWYCSYEYWTRWPTHTLFYDPLATAFANGGLALEEKVDPSLLSLANPYDPKERRGLEFPMDFSLYQGKYYLYFGPVPAVPLVILKWFGFGTIGDQYLVFAGICGLFIFQSLLIIYFRKRFLPTIPFWVLPLCILFAGLILPAPRLLTDGRVYETAVAAGQCFFIAGFYFIVTTLGEKNRLAWRFLVAGTLWALAIGSRITQIVPVGLMALMLLVFFIRTFLQTRLFSEALYPLLIIGLPLALGIIILGWYNWARFANVFETGFSYQLTTPNLQKYREVLFSPKYILPNVYNYVAAPPQVSDKFPFLKSVRRRGDLRFPFIELPKVYYTRSMTGILYSAPFVVFAGISILSIPFLRNRKDDVDVKSHDDDYLLKWILLSLLGSFLIAFTLTVSYFWVEIRFFTDFSASLFLLSIIGFWLGWRFLVRWPVIHKFYGIAGISLMLISILSSNLLLFSNQASIYQQQFPELWNLLSGISSKIIDFIP